MCGQKIEQWLPTAWGRGKHGGLNVHIKAGSHLAEENEAETWKNPIFGGISEDLTQS